MHGLAVLRGKIFGLAFYGIIPFYTPIDSGMRKSPTPTFSDSAGTRGTITRNFIGATAPRCGLNMSLDIDNKRQSTTPYLKKSNKLDTSIDQQFTNILFAPPIFTNVPREKLSSSSSLVLHTRCWIKLPSDPINISTPKFVNSGISSINALDKGASIWTPSTIVGRPRDVSHWIAPDQILKRTTAVGDSMIAKSDFKYKTVFGNWRENQ